MAITISCSPIYSVKYDYDTKTDFASLKTYDWLLIPAKADIDRLNVERIKNAVNSQMEAKGVRKAADNPDFLIASHVGKKEKVRVADWGYGYGSYGRYWGGYGGGLVELMYINMKKVLLSWIL